MRVVMVAKWILPGEGRGSLGEESQCDSAIRGTIMNLQSHSIYTSSGKLTSNFFTYESVKTFWFSIV